MPNVTLPVLAIREANDHLQALFTENQKLESQLHEQNLVLLEKEKENTKLNEEIGILNEHIEKQNTKYNEEIGILNERIDILKKDHNMQLCSLRDTLKIEHDEQLSRLRDEHSKHMLEQKQEMEHNHEVKLDEQEEFFRQEIEDIMVKNKHTSHIEIQKSLYDLETTLKQQEKEKISQLEKIVENEKKKIKVLKSEVSKLKSGMVQNTRKREIKIEELSKILNSTIGNMTLCIDALGEEDFVRSDNFIIDEYVNHIISDDVEDPLTRDTGSHENQITQEIIIHSEEVRKVKLVMVDPEIDVHKEESVLKADDIDLQNTEVISCIVENVPDIDLHTSAVHLDDEEVDIPYEEVVLHSEEIALQDMNDAHHHFNDIIVGNADMTIHDKHDSASHKSHEGSREPPDRQDGSNANSEVTNNEYNQHNGYISDPRL